MNLKVGDKLTVNAEVVETSNKQITISIGPAQITGDLTYCINTVNGEQLPQQDDRLQETPEKK